MEGITTSRETVRLIIKTLDPEGVKLRTAHRLKRREFISPGPNYTWYMYGYDKLKPYGFPIHAAIDGYSRKILLLVVSYSNSDSNVISSCFINFICQQLYVQTKDLRIQLLVVFKCIIGNIIGITSLGRKVFDMNHP